MRYTALLIIMLLMAAGLMTSFAPNHLLAGMNPTDQMETINALVDERFTQTAFAQQTAIMQTTVNAAFNRALTATATQWTLTPSYTPSLTTTPTPTLTFTASITPTPTPTSSPTLPPFDTPIPTATPNDNAQDLLIDGYEAYFQQNYDSAIEIFTQVTEAAPEWIEGYVALGLTYYVDEQWALASDNFAQAIELGNRDAYVFGLYGDALRIQGLFREAVEFGSRAIQLAPYYAFGYTVRGRAYREWARLDEAIIDFRYALELNPSYAFASNMLSGTLEDAYGIFAGTGYVFYTWLARGIDAHNEQNYSDAFSDYREAIEYFSDHVEDGQEGGRGELAYYNRARLYLDVEDYENALTDVNTALNLKADFAPAYTLRGQIYQAMGSNELALADYDHAVETDPFNASAYIWRARGYEQAGEASLPEDYWQWMTLDGARHIGWELSPSGQTTIQTTSHNWLYYIPFSGEAGEVVHIRVEAASNTTSDPVLVILNAEGEPVFAVDNGVSTSAEITGFTLQSDEAYMLVVGSFNARSMMNITLETISPEETATP